MIPSGKDPADAVREDPALWVSAVEDAKPVVTFYFDKVFRAENRDTVEGKKKISQALLPLVAELSDEIEKAHWVVELSERLGVAEEATWKELRKQGMPAALAGTPAQEKSATPTRRDLLEERFLTALALISGDARQREVAGRTIQFSTILSGEIFKALMAGEGAGVAPELLPHLETVRFKGEVLREVVPDIEKEFTIARRELEKLSLRERLSALGQEIAEGERGGNIASVTGLLGDFKKISEYLQTLS